MSHKVAICVGHSRGGDNGAASVDGTSEWNYNVDLASQIVTLLAASNVEAFVVSKYEGNGYTAAMKWLASHLKAKGATVAIELHFNSATPQARGHEWLCWRGSVRGEQLANFLRKSYAALFASSTDRGVKLLDKSDRGALFLSLTSCPAVICEPFFGSNKEEWKVAVNQKHNVALAMANGIKSYVLTL